MYPFWRVLVIFPLFCVRVPKVSSIWPPKKMHFPTKIDHFWGGMGATRCLKAKIAKNVFTLTILFFFLLFCVKVIKVHFGHWQKLAFLGENWLFWEGMDATRWFSAKIDKNVFTLTILLFFNYFALNSSKFILATDKNLLFSAKIDYFFCEGMAANR